MQSNQRASAKALGYYQEGDRSAVLGDLDLAQLSRFVLPGQSQTMPAKAYQAELRSLLAPGASSK